MKDRSLTLGRDWKRDLRTFGAGAACGFLAGALLVLIGLWQYNFIARPSSRVLNLSDDPGTAVLEPAAETPSSTVGRVVPTPAPPERAIIAPLASSPSELQERDLLIPVEG